MADIDAYKDKFSDSGRRVLDGAMNESKKRDQNYISIEHILHALADEEAELFNATMRDLRLTRARSTFIEKRLENSRAAHGQRLPHRA